MEDNDTPTRAQLDALFEAQSAKHIERLKRRANRSYFWVVALAALPLLTVLVAYRSEGKWPSAVLTGSLILSSVIGVSGFMRGRQDAARQLRKELSQ